MSRTPHASTWFFVPVLAVLSACVSEQSGSKRPLVRDSSGVRITESYGPALGDLGTWGVDSVPKLSIGSAEGANLYQFYRIREIVRLSDGRIVVANAGSGEILLFSAAGQYVRSIGRAGPGPGEFRGLRRVFVTQYDSLVVVDLGGVSIFDSAGTFVRGLPFGPRGANGRFSDGSFLLVTFQSLTALDALGLARDQMALVRIRGDGPRVDTLMLAAGSQRFSLQHEGGVSTYDAPFGPVLSVAVSGSQFFVGDGTTFRIERRDSNGNLLGVIQAPTADRRVRAEDIEEYETSLRMRPQNQTLRVQLERAIREWEYPSAFPAFDRLLVDSDSALWVRRYRKPTDTETTWSVFDSTGSWLVDIEMPEGLVPYTIDDSTVVGVMTDTLGVEYVRVHRLRKSQGKSEA